MGNIPELPKKTVLPKPIPGLITPEGIVVSPKGPVFYPEGYFDQEPQLGSNFSELEKLRVTEKEIRERATAVLPLAYLGSALVNYGQSLRVDFDQRMETAVSLGNRQKVIRPPSLSGIVAILKAIDESREQKDEIVESITGSLPAFDWEGKFPPETVKTAKLAFQVFRTFNRTPLTAEIVSELSDAAWAIAMNSVYNDKEVTFLAFSCPAIQGDLLAGTEASYYVSANAAANTTLTNLSTAAKLVDTLRLIGLKPQLIVIFADSDEDDYIWPAIVKPPNLDPKIVQERLDAQRIDLLGRCSGKISRSALRIYGWRELEATVRESSRPIPEIETVEQIIENVGSFFTAEEILSETEFMRRSATGWYKGGLGPLSSNQLDLIVRNKFATYAQQGVVLQRLFGSLFPIMLQNETPSFLRTKMVNLLLKSPFPTLYPYNYGELIR